MRRLATRSWRALKRFSARTPLRIKLITAALALVAIAIAVISAVSIAVFRGYLLHQADQKLKDASVARAHRTFGPSGDFVAPQPGQTVTAALFSRNGQVLWASQGQRVNTLPDIPLDASWLKAHTGQIVTVPAASGGGSWQVIVNPVHYTVTRDVFLPSAVTIHLTSLSQPGSPGTFVVGVDLGSINHTIGTLTMIDLSVGGIVIVILAGVGVALVRASLRPLAEIEQTAGAIAAGDLSRRVPDRDPRTEVGSLGRSLNIMLGQIERAFRAQSASEATARQSEERMRRFVGDASHELRTPLSVIRGFAEYYRQRGGLREAELDRMVRRVEDEAARMGMLVEDLLLLARMDQQRPLQRRPVDLLALAADAAQDARLLAPNRDIQLSVGSGGPFLVTGDEARLRQIIRNLVNNALTHTPDGAPVELRLRTCPAVRTPLDAAVVLEVADSGPGLTPEQAERVFERFYRADAARTRKTGGTGLGLAIVAALAAAHGGEVSVDSRPGEGATFRITLPMAPDAVGIHAADSDEEATYRET
ncbi:MAG TPA: HAMP domain-containing sensor histidine kinase [Streptosporangiaceae bacterium]|nr:HAMP domain-containing sensor histidine kinase [Streptosporangiaceae bacterium]